MLLISFQFLFFNKIILLLFEDFDPETKMSLTSYILHILKMISCLDNLRK